MKNPVDLSGFVNARGQPIYGCNSPSFVAARKTRAPAEAKHEGWIVQGFPPGYVEQSQREALSIMANWDRLTPDMQAREIGNGKRKPKPWDEVAWLKKAKRDRMKKGKSIVHFSTPETAETARQMLASLGWTHTETVELKKLGAKEKK